MSAQASQSSYTKNGPIIRRSSVNLVCFLSFYGVGSRCVGFAPNFGGGLRKKIKFSERTTFKIIGVTIFLMSMLNVQLVLD